MNSVVQPYFDSLSLTMRNIVDKWTKAQPGALQTMLRFPFGWVNQDGSAYDRPTGKRVRPLLLLLSTSAVGGNWHSALPAAAAVEILHNFSLVHDDIQDDSFTRHGRPTVWRVWGKPHAINAGDGLFTLAYAALAELPLHGVPLETANTAMQLFNQTNLELIRGQFLDMSFEVQPTVSTDEYISMITGKSAALIAACAQMGALIGGASSEQAALFREFGLNLGIAFQIRDDILGIWGDPALTGKSAATDILSKKKSLPVLHGLSLSPALVECYQAPEMTDSLVEQIVNLLTSVGSLDYANQLELQYAERALLALEQAKPLGTAGAELTALARQLLGRTA